MLRSKPTINKIDMLFILRNMFVDNTDLIVLRDLVMVLVGFSGFLLIKFIDM